jgi:hypothetical protein
VRTEHREDKRESNGQCAVHGAQQHAQHRSGCVFGKVNPFTKTQDFALLQLVGHNDVSRSQQKPYEQMQFLCTFTAKPSIVCKFAKKEQKTPNVRMLFMSHLWTHRCFAVQHDKDCGVGQSPAVELSR